MAELSLITRSISPEGGRWTMGLLPPEQDKPPQGAASIILLKSTGHQLTISSYVYFVSRYDCIYKKKWTNRLFCIEVFLATSFVLGIFPLVEHEVPEASAPKDTRTAYC